MLGGVIRESATRSRIAATPITMKQLLKRPLIVDGRNLYDPQKLGRLGFTYDSIGRPLGCASS